MEDIRSKKAHLELNSKINRNFMNSKSIKENEITRSCSVNNVGVLSSERG